MTRDEIYPDKYFKAANLSRPQELKIVSAIMETMKDVHGANVRKLVVGFEDTPTKLVCNRTNFDKLSELFGGDTDAWIGNYVQLYVDQVRFGGRAVNSVMVRAAKEGV
jgi:hypothetical protein